MLHDNGKEAVDRIASGKYVALENSASLFVLPEQQPFTVSFNIKLT